MPYRNLYLDNVSGPPKNGKVYDYTEVHGGAGPGYRRTPPKLHIPFLPYNENMQEVWCSKISKKGEGGRKKI